MRDVCDYEFERRISPRTKWRRKNCLISRPYHGGGLYFKSPDNYFKFPKAYLQLIEGFNLITAMQYHAPMFSDYIDTEKYNFKDNMHIFRIVENYVTE